MPFARFSNDRPDIQRCGQCENKAGKNDILYGSVKGLKVDRETEAVIAGAKFGLFRSGETEFTAENAILTVESGEDGVFTFENIPYGDWLIKEARQDCLHYERRERCPSRRCS